MHAKYWCSLLVLGCHSHTNTHTEHPKMLCIHMLHKYILLKMHSGHCVLCVNLTIVCAENTPRSYCVCVLFDLNQTEWKFVNHWTQCVQPIKYGIESSLGAAAYGIRPFVVRTYFACFGGLSFFFIRYMLSVSGELSLSLISNYKHNTTDSCVWMVDLAACLPACSFVSNNNAFFGICDVLSNVVSIGWKLVCGPGGIDASTAINRNHAYFSIHLTTEWLYPADLQFVPVSPLKCWCFWQRDAVHSSPCTRPKQYYIFGIYSSFISFI